MTILQSLIFFLIVNGLFWLAFWLGKELAAFTNRPWLRATLLFSPTVFLFGFFLGVTL